jgi:hypothetical protein
MLNKKPHNKEYWPGLPLSGHRNTGGQAILYLHRLQLQKLRFTHTKHNNELYSDISPNIRVCAEDTTKTAYSMATNSNSPNSLVQFFTKVTSQSSAR